MIPYIELHIVDHCNLNCVGCSHFSPLAEPYYKDIDEYREEMKELSKFEIGTIRIMGGEPLLHPKCLEFCEVTKEYFPRSNVVLVTNGILTHKLDKRKLKEMGVGVCISDYHLPSVEKSTADVVHNKATMYNICIDIQGKQEPQVAFAHCDLHRNHWYYYQNKKIYPCCIAPNLHYFNDYFDLDMEMADVGVSIDKTEKEIIDKLNEPNVLCRYCNTIKRNSSSVDFRKTRREITEWTCQS